MGLSDGLGEIQEAELSPQGSGQMIYQLIGVTIDSLFRENPDGARGAQFRAEEFNILNRANFNAPNAVTFTPTGLSPTAGVITSTSTASRQTQFALKLLW